MVNGDSHSRQSLRPLTLLYLCAYSVYSVKRIVFDAIVANTTQITFNNTILILLKLYCSFYMLFFSCARARLLSCAIRSFVELWPARMRRRWCRRRFYDDETIYNVCVCVSGLCDRFSGKTVFFPIFVLLILHMPHIGACHTRLLCMLDSTGLINPSWTSPLNHRGVWAVYGLRQTTLNIRDVI